MKKLFTIIFTISLLWGFSTVSYAKESQELYASLVNEKNFDAAGYAAAYPDVVAAVGTDANALYNHFITTGWIEGRQGLAKDIAITAKLKALNVAHHITNENMSDYEKVKVVHDWMTKNIYYDIQDWLTGESSYDKNYVCQDYDLVGPMIYGWGVCADYADTFAYFMRILDIKNRYVTGYADGGYHAWNQVMIDGQWLSIDVTWDDPISWNYNPKYNSPTHEYFLISNEKMERDHMTEAVYDYETNTLYAYE